MRREEAEYRIEEMPRSLVAPLRGAVGAANELYFLLINIGRSLMALIT